MRKILQGKFLLLLFWIVFYVFFQTRSIYGGDAGDFTSAACVGGIPHPPGFPLYSFLAYLLIKLPVSTISFRVGLLSSVSSALTLFFLFLILRNLFKNKLIPVITVFTLGFTYPVWLFSTIVEVYGMNILLSTLLVYFILRFTNSKKIIYLYTFFFLLGIALSHHQLILFLFPGFIFWFYLYRNLIPKNKLKLAVISSILFLIGFSSYLYLYLAARNIPILSWNNPDNLRNLIRLILKESYGVVYSGSDYSQKIGSRFILILAYFQYILQDFTPLGAILIFSGFILSFIKRKKIDIFFFLLWIFSGPILYFYSAFLLMVNYRLAIFEQFLSFSFIFIIYFLGRGIELVFLIIKRFVKKLTFSPNQIKTIEKMIYILFLLLPISLIYINYPKLAVLKNDFTAEKFALDILNSVEDHSIVFLGRDTVLFDSQYMYYCQKVKPSLKLLHVDRFLAGEYESQIKKYYPELKLPDSDNNLFSEFIKLNYGKFPIYSIASLPVDIDGSMWIHFGFLYRFYKKEDLPSIEYVKNKNTEIINQFNDPLSGSLGKYQNLYLADVLHPYEESYLDFSDFLLKTGFLKEALIYLNKAERLNNRNERTEEMITFIYIEQKECDKALTSVKKIQLINAQSLNYYLLMHDVYKNCFKDEETANKFFETYQKLKRQTEQPINKL